MEQVINGGNLMVWIAEIKNDKYVILPEELATICLATNHKLTISSETKDISTKDNGGKWKSSDVSKLSWTISSENFFVEKTTNPKTRQYGFGSLFEMMKERKKIAVIFAFIDTQDQDMPEIGWGIPMNNGYGGVGMITQLDLTALNDEIATFSMTIEGQGSLTHQKPISTQAVKTDQKEQSK